MRRAMKIQMQSPRAQTGAYLLEALIAILIFSFGVLGIVGLQAQALRFTNDSQYRAEAVYLANSLISQMWVDSYNTMGTISTIGFVAGGVLAATGVVLVVTAPKSKATVARVSPVVSPGFLGAEGSF